MPPRGMQYLSLVMQQILLHVETTVLGGGIHSFSWAIQTTGIDICLYNYSVACGCMTIVL